MAAWGPAHSEPGDLGESINHRRAEDGFQARPVVGVINVQNVFGFVDIRLDIKCRGELPPDLPDIKPFENHFPDRTFAHRTFGSRC